MLPKRWQHIDSEKSLWKTIPAIPHKIYYFLATKYFGLNHYLGPIGSITLSYTSLSTPAAEVYQAENAVIIPK